MLDGVSHQKNVSSKLSKLDSQISFKIILLGDTNTGKTSIIHQARGGRDKIYNVGPTMSFDYYTIIHEFESWIVKLQIWDTCGQEKFRSLTKNFYKNSDLAILVYSIDNLLSFNNIDIWLKELRATAKSDLVVFLVGNKIDKEEERQVSKEMLQDFIDKNNIDLAMEVSAETGVEIRELFVKSALVLSESYFNAKSFELSDTNLSKDTILQRKQNANSRPSQTLSTTLQTNKKKLNCCN
jgi:small GTP-binding protein